MDFKIEKCQHLYELAANNVEHALCLTSGIAAVCHQTDWWADVNPAISTLGNNHHNTRGARKHFQDTIWVCKQKLQVATATGDSFEANEAVLQPLMQCLLLERLCVASHPGELTLSSFLDCIAPTSGDQIPQAMALLHPWWESSGTHAAPSLPLHFCPMCCRAQGWLLSMAATP